MSCKLTRSAVVHVPATTRHVYEYAYEHLHTRHGVGHAAGSVAEWQECSMRLTTQWQWQGMFQEQGAAKSAADLRHVFPRLKLAAVTGTRRDKPGVSADRRPGRLIVRIARRAAKKSTNIRADHYDAKPKGWPNQERGLCQSRDCCSV